MSGDETPTTSWRGNVVAVGLGLVVALGLGEAAVRFFVPPAEAEPVRRGPMTRRGVHEFRDREQPEQAPDGTVRAAFVGDSYTYGQGVEVRDRFGERVARDLSRSYGVDVVPLNFGQPGANTRKELRFLVDLVPPYSPEIVVWSFVLNDFATDGQTQAFLAERRQMLAEHDRRFPGLRWAAQRSRLAALVNDLLFATTSGIRDRQLEFVADLYAPGPVRDRQEVLLDRAFARMADYPVGVVVLMPYLLEGEADLDFYQYTEALLREGAAKHGLPYVEVLPHLGERPFHEWWVSRDDHHPNAEAHAIIGDLVHDAVVEATGADWDAFARRNRAMRRRARLDAGAEANQ